MPGTRDGTFKVLSWGSAQWGVAKQRSIATGGGNPALSVPVRARPGAGRTRVGGSYPGPDGPALIVAVTTPPVDGRATEAIAEALAAALGLRAAAVTLRVGATSRNKVFTVPATPAVRVRLAALLEPADPDRPA